MAFDPETAGVAVAPPAKPAFNPETAGVPFDPKLYEKQQASGAFAGIPGQLAQVGRLEEARKQGLDPALAAFVERNKRPGVPLDPTEMLPAGIRARVSVEDDPKKQAELLSKQPGILSTRVKDGRVIATLRGDNGNEKDVLLHPSGLNIAGNAVPIAKGAALLASVPLTEGATLPETAAILGAATGVNEILTKFASRKQAGMEADVPDLLLAGGKEAAINAAAPIGGEILSKGIRGALTTAAGPLEETAVEAGKRLNVPITPAQATGSGLLARSERLPLLKGGAEKAAAEQQGALQAATARQVGPSGLAAVPAEADIANRVQSRISANALAAQEGADLAKRDVATTAGQGIQAGLNKALGAPQATQTQAGAAVRSAIGEKLDAFKAAQAEAYDKLFENAAANNVRVETTPVVKLAEQLAAEDPQNAIAQLIPQPKQITKLAAQLGVPTAPVEAGEAAATSLDLPQAIKLRAIIRDKIAVGQLPGQTLGKTEETYYTRLADSLTKGINDAVAKAPEAFQKQFADTTANYREFGQPFRNFDVRKLFADPQSGRYLGDSEVIPSLFSGKGNLDALRAYRDVLGAQSPEYRLVLRQGMQHLIDDAGTTGGLLNADKFLAKLGSLSPEMQAEVLGPSARAIASNAQIMAAARGARVDPEDLKVALTSAPGQAPAMFKAAMQRQADVDQAYSTGIMKNLRNGTFGDESVTSNPDTFVTRFLKNASAGDVEKVLPQLGPRTQELLRQRTLANILEDVRAKPAVGEATTGLNTRLDAARLVENYLTGPARAKYQAVLGKDGVRFLEDLATVHEAITKSALQAESSSLSPANRAAYLAGDVAPGARGPIRTAVRAGLLLPEYAVGILQRNPAIRRYLVSGELPPIGRFTRAELLAAPEQIEQAQNALAQQPPGSVRKERDKK